MACFIAPIPRTANSRHTSVASPFRGRLLTRLPSSLPAADDRYCLSSPRITPHAQQHALGATPDKSSSRPDDDDLPGDFGADLESALLELGEKMSKLPEPSPDQPAHRRAADDTDPYGKARYLRAKKINNQLNDTDDSDEEWTYEQRALYSLVKHYDDEEDQQTDPMLLPSLQTEAPIEHSSNRELRKSQTDPRQIKSNVQISLRTLRQRRKRLVAETAEEGPNSLQNLLTGKGDKKVDLLERRQREAIKNRVVQSLQRSRILDFSRDIHEPSEMTAGANRHFLEAWRVPHLYRPHFGIQDAFRRLDYPPCPRCGRGTSREQLIRAPGICDICYSQIYLETPIGSGTIDPSLGYDPHINKEFKHLELKQAEAAARVARSISGRFSALEESEMTAAERGSGDSTNVASTEQGTGPDGGTTVNLTKSGKGADMNGTGEPPKRRRGRHADQWNINASDRSLRTINPIRNLVQNIDVKPNPKKEVIRLSVGDPTVYGNLAVSQKAVDTFCEVIRSGKANGYSMSMGGEIARQAVAKRYTSERSPLTKDDIILTVGTSGALELALGAIANEGDNILLPRPGFPLFRTIAEGYGIECQYYEVDANKNWEINLGDLTALANDRTRAIVVNNPSNPCGSVYSATHIEDLLAVASVLKLPIIADEVYADMVFSKQTFTSIGEASADVPVLSVGGMSKQFVVPGWRLGWLIVHDRNKTFDNGKVRQGLRQLTTRMLVPNTPAQHVLPTLLNLGMGTLMKDLEANAEFTVQCLEDVPGLRVIQPQGAMYAMLEIDAAKLGVEDDMDFVKKLLSEESVFVLPGQCFQAKNFVRIVFSAPKAVLAEAFDRMKEFCSRRCRAE